MPTAAVVSVSGRAGTAVTLTDRAAAAVTVADRQAGEVRYFGPAVGSVYLGQYSGQSSSKPAGLTLGETAATKVTVTDRPRTTVVLADRPD